MMLYWEAMFQIPNSGTQSREVYAFVDEVTIDKIAKVKFYADKNKESHLFDLDFVISDPEKAYDELLKLDYFKKYKDMR